MSETKQVGSQKITTYYDEEKKEEEILNRHSDRRALNRKIRNESGHAPVEPMADHIDKPKKKAAVREEEEYYDGPEPRRPRKQKTQQPLPNQIGSRIPAALGGTTGRPAWLNTGTPAMPHWMRAGSGDLPSWARGGSNPLVPAAAPRRRRRTPHPPQQNNGLPPWFRY